MARQDKSEGQHPASSIAISPILPAPVSLSHVSAMQESIKINEVPEVILKKRKQRQVSRAKDVRAKIKQRALQKRQSGQLIFKRAEKFVKERRKKDKDKKRLKRNAKVLVRYLEENAGDSGKQLLFVIRLAASIPMTDSTKRAMRELGIATKFSGTFVVDTPETKRLLAIAEPFVTWGPPNLRSIRELIFKRGLGRKEKKAAPLMDNTVIEAALGDAGVICMEDLVHEIFTVGQNFAQVNHFVGKFSLSKPLTLPADKMSHFAIGGRFGDRGDKINDLIQAMV